ncbi:hypothetical protein IC620_15320 [Hazenella sp. IB182357]|uniref:DUF3168 domain-containing protein n=1 Tax=Polycladospora coralii TaxID=2771432 RepID=A0A926NE31_9BACL|nr:hypothetical protein [Polycladospora coralii]MBD1373715.1 hypothetical protein [Polycladospora coralii]
MINIKPIVYQALGNNQALISIVGDRIDYLKSSSNDLPRITFFEVNNVDGDYVDDQAQSGRVSVQVSIWCGDATHLTPIIQEVNNTMKEIGFYRTSSVDLYENDTQIYHKALRYSAKFNL